MKRRWLLLVPAAVVAGALLGRVGPVVFAVVSALAIGAAAALALAWVQRRHVLDLAEAVNEWLGSETAQPLELPPETPWQQLGVVLNALGASYSRRGARLRTERPLRRELVEVIGEPALLFSSDDHLLSSNEGARELLGVPDADGVTLVQALGSATLVAAVREARATGGPVHVDADLGRGEVRATATPVGDEVLLVLRDVTEQRRTEELRRDFVVNASHELKTPVTSISSLTDALAVSLRANPDRAAQLVTRLSEESDRLVRLVGDLLDLRRLEEHDPLERGPVDLVTLVEDVLAGAAPDLESRGITVTHTAPEAATVVGVEHELRLVVDNLVRNAVQYNDDGGAVVVELDRDGGTYVLSVSDTGLGIPQQDLDRIFERFYRVDVARSRERGGTGLGLSIARHAIHRHGGSIDVESLLGEGTTFRVRFPIEPR